MCKKNIGFSLIELLVVISIIAIIMAIVIPAALASRRKALAVACASNLRQCWQASAMYASDYDDNFPYGVSRMQKEESFLQGRPERELYTKMKNINDVIYPYSKSLNIWKCPSDYGGDHLFLSDIKNNNSYYDAFGLSYFYEARLAVFDKKFSSVQAWRDGCPFPEIDSSKIILFCDQSFEWHKLSYTGGWYDVTFLTSLRVSAVAVDGHLFMNQKRDQSFTPYTLILKKEDTLEVPC